MAADIESRWGEDGTGAGRDGFDRAAGLRRQPDRLAALLADPGARVMPMVGVLTLVDGPAGAPRVVALAGMAAERARAMAAETVFLGLRADGAPLFACDVPQDAVGEGAQDGGTDGAERFGDLRDLGAVLSATDAGLGAYARGLLQWHRTHRFCGRCGAPTRAEDGGHARRCQGPGCGAQHFPRTDPVVIMLTVDGPAAAGGRCLLGRQARWPRGLYSTLAGFVEPGERLEDAVAREVAEETGVPVAAVRYMGSQPHPFPASLMLGFLARAAAAELVLDGAELADARWFTADEVRAFPGSGLRLPRPDAIAHQLVAAWLAGAPVP